MKRVAGVEAAVTRAMNRTPATVFRIASTIVLAFLALAIPSALTAQAPAAKPAPAPAEAPTVNPDEYRIGPGDALQVFVWKEPELTRDVVVRIDGKVTIPLLGDVTAAGRKPSELSAEITKLLSRFLSAPQVSVGVGVANNARFYVLGQVVKSGDFPLIGRTTLLQGLALAGGFREYAKSDSIVVVRQDRGTPLPGRPSEEAIYVNYKKLETGKSLADNIILKPGDTILVP